MAVAFLVCAAPPALGVTLNVPALRTGWYDDEAGPNPTRNPNYFTGYGDVEHRSFFAFSLEGVKDQIPSGERVVGASLVLHTFDFQSQDPAETFGLFDVATPLDRIDSGDDFLNTFLDLGTGHSYGQFVYSNADHQTLRTLALNDVAVADLLAALNVSDQEVFIMGGAIQTLDGVPATNSTQNEFIFGSSGGGARPILALQTGPVPEPTSLVLVALAVLTPIWRRRPADLR